MSNPITIDDFPDFVKPEDLEGLSQEELRAKLETIERRTRLGVLSDEGKIMLDDSEFDYLPVTAG